MDKDHKFKPGDRVSFTTGGDTYFGTIKEMLGTGTWARVSCNECGATAEGYVFAPDSYLRDPGATVSTGQLKRLAQAN